MINRTQKAFVGVAVVLLFGVQFVDAAEVDDDTTVRVFIFAGQSNMVGSDSKVQDISGFLRLSGWKTPSLM